MKPSTQTARSPFILPSLSLSNATVEVTIDARKVTVTGPRGTLSRAFRSRHMDMMVVGEPGAQKIRIDLWFGIRKQIALTCSA